ncbi:methylenetetrahydrofolate reductase [Candidatus Woesearchaeota archaeon]|nr:methylenetetrahydrofolate reductase [Candidatus Woesearchaeota archaeon]
MTLLDILRKNEFTLSVELAPPNGGFDICKLKETVAAFNQLGVDFYSMTMGAAGNRLKKGTISLAHKVQDWTGKNCIVHLTCLGYDKERIEEEVVNMHHLELENILALRGDLSMEKKKEGAVVEDYLIDYRYATDLIAHLTKLNNFCIGGAAYPEGYGVDKNISTAVLRLKQKQDAGAKFAITQMLFDAEIYFIFVEKCRDAGISIPIIPGVWMIKSYDNCLTAEKEPFYVTVPDNLQNLFKSVTKEEGKQIGLDHTFKLCHELKEKGAPGVQLYLLGADNYSLDLLRRLKR